MTPKERLNLPELELAGTDESIINIVKESFEQAFANLNQEQEIDIVIKGNIGADFNIKVSVLPEDKHQFIIWWEEKNQDNIAVDEVFPLIRACHKYLSWKDNKSIIRYELQHTTDSLDVPMRFISSLLAFREKCLKG